MIVRLFSIVWGDQFLDWFERGCARSLGWQKNRAAAQRGIAAWDVWTTKRDRARAAAIASSLGIPVEIHADLTGDRETDMLKALVAQMQLCQRLGAAFLFAAPDSIFGDGSVGSFLQIGSVPGVCVAAAPMRVVADGFIEAMGEVPVSNPKLVKLAFERMHPGFRNAEVGLEHSNSYQSGMSWRRLGGGLYAVTYRMHSAYLMKPEPLDIQWFRKLHPKFGSYDWSFPKTLVFAERQRVVGSSDAAFVVELTPAGVDHSNTTPANPDEPDAFEKNLLHHRINRNIVCIWREEA